MATFTGEVSRVRISSGRIEDGGIGILGMLFNDGWLRTTYEGMNHEGRKGHKGKRF